MTAPILLVQGDTRPSLVVTLTDETAALTPINLSGCTVRMYFRGVDDVTLTDTLVGNVLDPAIGLCKFDWGATTLDCEEGSYLGEFEITFQDGTVQSVFDVLPFYVRQQF